MNIEVEIDQWTLRVHFEERVIGQEKRANKGQCSIDVFVFCIWHSRFAY